jgi:hypothetical protein
MFDLSKSSATCWSTILALLFLPGRRVWLALVVARMGVPRLSTAPTPRRDPLRTGTAGRTANRLSTPKGYLGCRVVELGDDIALGCSFEMLARLGEASRGDLSQGCFDCPDHRRSGEL